MFYYKLRYENFTVNKELLHETEQNLIDFKKKKIFLVCIKSCGILIL